MAAAARRARKFLVRTLAWLLVVAGVLIIIAGPIYASVDTGARDRRWFRRALESGDPERVDSAYQMLLEGVRPGWVVVSPWPIVMAGASVTAFGVLLLAIRRPDRPRTAEEGWS